jgi:competence protein ComEC
MVPPGWRDLAPLALGSGAACALAGWSAGGLLLTAVALVAAASIPRRPLLVGSIACIAVGGFIVGGARLAVLDRDPLADRIGTRMVGVEAVIDESWRGNGPTRLAIARLRAPVEGRVLVRAAITDPPPRGTIVVVDGVLSRPRGSEDGFDERAWLARSGVHAVLRVDHMTARGWRGGVRGVVDRARWVALEPIDRAGEDDPNALVAGLVYGVQSGIRPAAIEDMRRSGLAHLLAVSGGNVALLVTLILLLTWLAGGARRIALILSIGGIAGYAGIVGLSPSVGRATVAGMAACAAWLGSRPRDAWRALSLGFAALAVVNPRSLGDPGFQLSFVAVAAILLIAVRAQRLAEGTPIPRILAAGFAVTAAATIATAPVSWWHFGRASLVGAVPANLLAMPAVPLVLWLGLGASFLYPVAPALGVGLAEVAALPAWWVLQSATWGAALDRRAPTLAGPVLGLILSGAAAWMLLRRTAPSVGSAHGRRRRPRARLPDRR